MKSEIIMLLLLLSGITYGIYESRRENYLADYMKYSYCACRKIDPSELVQEEKL